MPLTPFFPPTVSWVPQPRAVVGMGVGVPGMGIGISPQASAPPAAGTNWNQALQNVSAITAIGGAVTAAIGAYASANAQKHQLRSQASALEFQEQMSQINARAAENDAQAILKAGNEQIGLIGMRYAQEKASLRASTAARGVTLGEGNAAEVQASVSLARDIDIMTLRANSVREAGNARLRGVNARTEGTMAGVSASNLRATAGTINPLLQGHTTLLGAAPLAADYFGARSRRRY